MVKYLIETCHCDPMCVDKDGRTPLHYAVTYYKLHVVKYLIETCHCDPMCVNKYGRSALFHAVVPRLYLPEMNPGSLKGCA